MHHFHNLDLGGTHGVIVLLIVLIILVVATRK
jgi:hypothetical protein